MNDSVTVAQVAADGEALPLAGAPPWHGRQAECSAVLQAVLDTQPEVQMACLSMVDGRPFASASARACEPQRIAALGSSLLAICESFSREVGGGPCHHNTISMDHGSIVTVRVPMTPPVFALSVCVDRGANLAMALRWTLDAAARLATRLALPGHG